MKAPLSGIAELPSYIRLANKLLPLHLLTLFAKGDKANLTKAERNALADLVSILVDLWEGKTNHEHGI